MSVADEARAEAERYARADLGMAADEPNDATGFQKQVEFAEAVHHFMAGAQWQASRPFTEEDVEAAAKVIYADYASEYECAPWDLADRGPSLRLARAALAAVQSRNPARHTKGDGNV